jgi:hypothetical protein
LIALTFAIGAIGCSKKKQFIHYDGYYSNQQQYSSVLMFFRYYADGIVTVALPVTEHNVTHYSPHQLDKDSKECTIRGKYILDGNKIKFSLADKNGSVDFAGEFKENKLVLKSHSNINGRDSENIYDFYRW